ncbi:MAG: membrane protein insertase YidC [Flavobacteriales bacterium]|nr:membrane protein insertase YidC [Flavobacteriales bacterium]
MDRNSIIGLVLIAAILIGYQIYTAPTPEELARQQRQQDSLAQVEIQQKEQQAQLAAAEQSQAQAVAPIAGLRPVDSVHVVVNGDTLHRDSVDLKALRDQELAKRFGVFAPAAEGAHEEVTIENERLQVSFNTQGAAPNVIRLKEYTTYGKSPLLLADPDSGTYEFRFFAGNLDISTKDLHFKAEKLGTDGVRFTAPTSDAAKQLRITYTLDSAGWFMNVNTELVGLQGEVDPRTLFFHWDLVGRANEKHLPTERQKSTVFYKYQSDDRNYLSETEAEEKDLEGRTNWVAFKQDFFTVAMVSDQGFASNGSKIGVRVPSDSSHTKAYSAKLFFETEPAASVQLPMRLYLGPNHYNTLRKTGIDQFNRIIDLGWGIFGWMNRFVVIPIFDFFSRFNLSYGIIILLLTIAIKLLLMPLTYRNQKSSARMRVLKPEIDAINKKYPDPEDMMKRQQANMELYRKAGVNPAAGCVPLLIQMPVLYAMFRFFPSSIELRQQSFLWADDLSSYDSILTLPFAIPAYGSHVSLFTLLMSASTVIYTLINSKQMPTQQGMPSMKLMMYLFPVMMLFFMNSLPAGLSYYYLLANVISILQMTLLSKWFIDETKLRAELEQNMRTPKKKSKWQQRMEDIQKQQQAQARRRK